MATSQNLVARNATLFPARVSAPVPSTRRNSSVQPHRTAPYGVVSASSAQIAPKTHTKQSSLTAYLQVLGVAYIATAALLAAIMPTTTATIVVVLATIALAFVINGTMSVRETMRREAEKVQREVQRAEREADRLAEREAQALIRDLRIKAAQADAYAAFVRAQRAQRSGTRR